MCQSFCFLPEKENYCSGVVSFSPCYYRVQVLPWEKNIATGNIIFLTSSGLWRAKVNTRPLLDAYLQGTFMWYFRPHRYWGERWLCTGEWILSNSSMFGCEILILLFVDAENSPFTQLCWPPALNHHGSRCLKPQGWSNPKTSISRELHPFCLLSL